MHVATEVHISELVCGQGLPSAGREVGADDDDRRIRTCVTKATSQPAAHLLSFAGCQSKPLLDQGACGGAVPGREPKDHIVGRCRGCARRLPLDAPPRRKALLQHIECFAREINPFTHGRSVPTTRPSFLFALVFRFG